MLQQSTTLIRKLSLNDKLTVQQLQTNIEDDYVIKIFPDLVQSKMHAVYGLFENDTLITIAGYSLFPGGYAMLGRLRSDIRYHAKGYATKILNFIIEDLKTKPYINWIGGNTNIHNHAARRVLDKLELDEIKTLHSLSVKDANKLNGTPGDIWGAITSIAKKREVLTAYVNHNVIDVYPYECYYPFPFTQELVSDQHLAESTFYLNPTKDRLMIIKNDQKREWFAQVKYFWNDHFEQPGFWETVYHYIENNPDQPRPWLDFSDQGFKQIPDYDAFDLSDGWILHGNWIN
ncbi:hypothetical protein GCM10011351_22690 [Paraliobacillus quinghaiensis]|uniref:N-acetyltransferase domain-containing protein n=1 Tax=Paraliobacillus quinghaiensis TaxID=470815 RepID=A0A917WWR6_9BACI|nr:N-acetyltransferase [Paraliobacillus quinghaiensis]GGM36076.1 hypothetical protein GCM10011351_22690 [Paraliobacillus quinghaiensis]